MSVRLDLIPLVNIVFLLLMFFIVSGHIRGRIDDVDIPVSPFERPTFIGTEEDMTLYVNKAGHIRVADRPFMPWQDVKESLRQDIASVKQGRIVLAVDGHAPSGVLHKILSFMQTTEDDVPSRLFLVLSRTAQTPPLPVSSP